MLERRQRALGHSLPWHLLHGLRGSNGEGMLQQQERGHLLSPKGPGSFTSIPAIPSVQRVPDSEAGSEGAGQQSDSCLHTRGQDGDKHHLRQRPRSLGSSSSVVGAPTCSRGSTGKAPGFKPAMDKHRWSRATARSHTKLGRGLQALRMPE